MDIIELERERSESLAKKIKDIDFEVLLSRPPEGKYDKYVQTKNFDDIDDQSNCKSLWEKWEE